MTTSEQLLEMMQRLSLADYLRTRGEFGVSAVEYEAVLVGAANLTCAVLRSLRNVEGDRRIDERARVRQECMKEAADRRVEVASTCAPE